MLRRALFVMAVVASASPAGAGEFHVDPASGSDAGDGSAAHPWKSLQAVVDGRVETRGWDALPWNDGRRLIPVNAGQPVKPGDTIWVHAGDHGALVIDGAYNSAPVTLAAVPGASPRFTRVQVRSSRNWVLSGFSVSPSHGGAPAASPLVGVDDDGWGGPASDVAIDGFEIFTVPDERVWTSRGDWDANAVDAIGAGAARVTVRNCRIRNVAYGIAVSGQGSRVEHNLVDGFCGDGLRGLGDDEVFEYNLVKNARDVNDDHRDGFQSWSFGPGGVGTGVVRNVTLRGNVIIGYDDPSVPFAGTLQGIGCFDGLYEGWTVENNVVVTDHWHGISFYGARDLRIVNNTVLDLNAVEPGPPWIMVTDHKDGTQSSDVLVRNNLAAELSLEGVRVTADHNLVLPSDLSGFFVDASRHDVHLAAGSKAIDEGTSEGAPVFDADGVARPYGAAADLGAYEYAPGVERPPGGNAGPGGGSPSAGATSSSGCGVGGAGSASLAGLLLLVARRRPSRPSLVHEEVRGPAALAPEYMQEAFGSKTRSLWLEKLTACPPPISSGSEGFRLPRGRAARGQGRVQWEREAGRGRRRRAGRDGGLPGAESGGRSRRS